MIASPTTTNPYEKQAKYVSRIRPQKTLTDGNTASLVAVHKNVALRIFCHLAAHQAYILNKSKGILRKEKNI